MPRNKLLPDIFLMCLFGCLFYPQIGMNLITAQPILSSIFLLREKDRVNILYQSHEIVGIPKEVYYCFVTRNVCVIVLNYLLKSVHSLIKALCGI